MNRICSLFVIFLIGLFSSPSYSAPLPYEKIMPYIARTGEVMTRELTVKEIRLLNENNNNVEVLKKLYVQPINDLGYDYSDTIEHYSNVMANGDFTIDQLNTLNYFMIMGIPPLSTLVTLQKAGYVTQGAVDAIARLPKAIRPGNDIEITPSKTDTPDSKPMINLDDPRLKAFNGVWRDKNKHELVISFALPNALVTTRGTEADSSVYVTIESMPSAERVTVSFEIGDEGEIATERDQMTLSLKMVPNIETPSLEVTDSSGNVETYEFLRALTPKDTEDPLGE